MSSRELDDWISAYLKYTENSEPPKSYHVWTAISSIAGALQRKVRLVWGYEILYPNLYIVLVGPSGRCKKGTAMTLGMEILKEVGVTTIPEDVTRAQLIRRMSEAVSSFNDSTTKNIIFHCSVTCFSEELSVFLKKNNMEFLATLTNWYDSRDEWTYETKHAGVDKIQGVCFNFLGGTAPDWIPAILPQEAIGGGFTSRIIFVVEEDKYKTVPSHTLTDDELRLKGALIRDLQRIYGLSGEYKFSDDAARAYEEWYSDQDKRISMGQSPVPDPRFAGYVERRATHARKLSMVLTASRTPEKIIQIGDFERALEYLRKAEFRMAKAFGGVGKSQYAQATEQVLLYLKSRNGHAVKRSELLRSLYRDVDASTLQIVSEILNQMKVVRIETNPMEGEVFYKYVGEGKD
jgi:hypothetical protein